MYRLFEKITRKKPVREHGLRKFELSILYNKTGKSQEERRKKDETLL